MYSIPFVDAHLAKISLWSELFGSCIGEYILFRCQENY